jgi:hypothetical protein
MPKRRYTAEETIGKLRDKLLKREIFCTPRGGASPCRALVAAVQPQAPAQLAGEPAARARGVPRAELGISIHCRSNIRTNIEPGTEDGTAHHDPAAC